MAHHRDRLEPTDPPVTGDDWVLQPRGAWLAELTWCSVYCWPRHNGTYQSTTVYLDARGYNVPVQHTHPSLGALVSHVSYARHRQPHQRMR